MGLKSRKTSHRAAVSLCGPHSTRTAAAMGSSSEEWGHLDPSSCITRAASRCVSPACLLQAAACNTRHALTPAWAGMDGWIFLHPTKLSPQPRSISPTIHNLALAKVFDFHSTTRKSPHMGCVRNQMFWASLGGRGFPWHPWLPPSLEEAAAAPCRCAWRGNHLFTSELLSQQLCFQVAQKGLMVFPQ